MDRTWATLKTPQYYGRFLSHLMKWRSEAFEKLEGFRMFEQEN